MKVISTKKLTFITIIYHKMFQFAKMSRTMKKMHFYSHFLVDKNHGLRTANEGINQRYLKNWADVADKICLGRT